MNAKKIILYSASALGIGLFTYAVYKLIKTKEKEKEKVIEETLTEENEEKQEPIIAISNKESITEYVKKMNIESNTDYTSYAHDPVMDEEEPIRNEDPIESFEEENIAEFLDNGSSPEDDEIKIITQDEYYAKEHPEYDTEELTYYKDGVLANEYDKKIFDIDEYVPEDFVNEDTDIIYVQNDIHQKYYTIVSDPRSFDEMSNLYNSGFIE